MPRRAAQYRQRCFRNLFNVWRVPLKLAIRGVVTWAIEAAALAMLARVLPGVSVADWQIGLLAILVIGALNALVRPVIVLLAVNLGLVPLAFVTLVLNAVLVLLAARLVQGFTVDTLWTAFLLAFGL